MRILKDSTLIEKLVVLAIVAILGSLVFTYSANAMSGPAPDKSVKSAQAKEAEVAANSIQFSGNAEIENIKKRLELTSDPGLLGFVLLLNEMGQPVAYYGVEGKLTSGGKRLTRNQQLVRCDRGEWKGDCVFNAPSDEGTHGSSAPYVFFWTTDGQYVQWNGKYLYSDKPFRLTVDPIVVSSVSE